MRNYAKQIESLGYKISKCKKYAMHTKYGYAEGKTYTAMLNDIRARLLDYHFNPKTTIGL